MANEIDEFLRRVAERGKRNGVEPAPRPTSQEVPATPKVSEKPVVAETAADTPIGRQVTEHVTKYLDEQEFARRSAQLGAEVVEVDREVDQHLHQTFDHSVSKLATVPGEAAAPPPPNWWIPASSFRTFPSHRLQPYFSRWPTPTPFARPSCSTKSCTGRRNAGCRASLGVQGARSS